MRQLFFKKKRVTSTEQYAIVRFWGITPELPGGHVSLEIYSTHQSVYVSLWYQGEKRELETSGLLAQRNPRPAFWVESFNDDCAIIAFRKHAENLQLNAKEILKKIQDEHFTESALPDNEIRLHTLDCEKILLALNTIKKEHRWASFSGHRYHPEKAHNCASIIFSLLITGGIQRETTYAHYFRCGALATSILAAPYYAASLLGYLTICVGSVAMGGALGGAMDGVRDIRHFRQVTAAHGDAHCQSDIGLSILALFISGMASLIGKDRLVIDLLTLPSDVLEISIAAKQREEHPQGQERTEMGRRRGLEPWTR